MTNDTTSLSKPQATNLAEMYDVLLAASEYVLKHLNGSTSETYDANAPQLLAVDDMRRSERFRAKNTPATAEQVPA